jgi:hypothetical protein
MLKQHMANNSNTRWNDKDDRRLLAMQAAGKSKLAIAAALKRGVKATMHRYYFLRAQDAKTDVNDRC